MKELIKISEISKTQIKTVVDNLENLVSAGDVSPLEIYLQAKMYSEVSKKIIDSKIIKGGAFDEGENYKNETFNGCKITYSQTGDTLDYDSDEEYRQISEALKKRKDILKQAHDSSKKGGVFVDGNSGEVVAPPKIKKESEAVIKITFKD